MEWINEIPKLALSEWHWLVTSFYFMITKAVANSLKHNYDSWKKVLHIPDGWDWWFNPATSWKNKYNYKWLGIFVGISDCWHTLWTVWIIWYQVALTIETGNPIFAFVISGGIGMYLIFNPIYNWLRSKRK